MNDDDLITTLREQRGTVRMDTPMEEIVSRGRAVRARRRAPVAAAALGTAAAAAVAVGVALPASHPARHPGGGSPARLAAWMVTREHDGSIKITVRELRDPAGLQSRLRADGVPASVTFDGQPNPACHGFAGGGTQSQRRQRLRSVFTVRPRGHSRILIIHPGRLPSGAGILISTGFHRSPGPADLTLGLVQASPQCTGS